MPNRASAYDDRSDLERHVSLRLGQIPQLIQWLGTYKPSAQRQGGLFRRDRYLAATAETVPLFAICVDP